jgi:GMP synthase-like glutamine amidotransferase
MPKALIVTNIQREQPGAILDVLKERNWEYNIFNLGDGDTAPSPKDYDAMIVMGGPSSANDTASQTPWMSSELDKIREALALQIPYLGVCLGMQTLVKAAGGAVIKSPRKEVGFRVSYGQPLGETFSVTITSEGKTDPFFNGLPDTFPLFHLHGESVALLPSMKPTATLIATAAVVPMQIIRIGKNAYGTQGHFELTPQLLETWLAVDPDLLELGEKGMEQIRKDFKTLQDQYITTAKTLYSNFLTLAE